MEKNDCVTITKKLVGIPSYISNDINEKKMADFIVAYLKKLEIPTKKQYINKNRYNVIATIGNPKLWLCGHMDTVEPKSAKQLKPFIVGNKLYGLGTIDMKSGIAAILDAVKNAKQINNLGLLFYCDEEYSFQGMKKFLENFTGKPKLTVVAEPTNLAISNAHRGLIELSAIIRGKTGHASRPEEGINAITNSVCAVKKLSEIIQKKYSSKDAGISTCTLSAIKGGLRIQMVNDEIVYSQGTNSIPDIAEIKLDIRPANKLLRGKEVVKLLGSTLQSYGLEIEKINVTQDFGPLLTEKKELGILEKIISKEARKVSYLPSQKMGYGDGQLFFEKTNTPVVYFGPGPTETCHIDNEYVNIPSIKKTADVFRKLIEEFTYEK